MLVPILDTHKLDIGGVMAHEARLLEARRYMQSLEIASMV